MSARIIFFSLAFVSFLVGCRPKPLDIDIAQNPGKITISSVALDEDGVFISAGYSIDGYEDMNGNSGNEKGKKQPDLLIEDATVTIAAAGALPDTLAKYASGLFGRSGLHLMPNTQYTLTVVDKARGNVVTATTTYMPKPKVEQLKPEVVYSGKDTLVKLHIRLSDVQQGDRYFIGYTNGKRSIDRNVPGELMSASFKPKQLELINGTDARSGMLEKTFTILAKATDTLTIHVGRIDDAYYKYLTAYKKSGFFLNQLAGEPINLPSNVNTGLGFFSLYRPERQTYNLPEY